MKTTKRKINIENIKSIDDVKQILYALDIVLTYDQYYSLPRELKTLEEEENE